MAVYTGDELVLYKFENDASVVNSGRGSTTYDSSFTGNTAYTTNPRFGTYSTTYDGSGDAIDSKFGNGRNPSTAPYSIACWAKRTGAGGGGDEHLFGTSATPAASRCYVRYRQSNGFWGMRIQGNAALESSISVTLNQWFHVCLVMDGTNARLYIDGTQRLSDAYTSYTLPGPIYCGNIWENGVAQATQGWNGYVDDFSIWSRALSATEVYTLANQITFVPQAIVCGF